MVRLYNWVGFSLLFILSCGNPINIQDIRSTGTFNVTSVSIVNNQLIVNGNGFQEITGLALSDGSSFYKPFRLSSYTNKKIVGLNQEPTPISVPSFVMNLIIDTAEGASSIPVTFTLQTDSVYTGAIKDGAVTLEKLSPIGAQEGDVILFEGGQFVLAPAASAGSGTGGVDRISFGEGIVGEGTSSTATIVPIGVNIGTTGSSTSTYIPFYNAVNELEIDKTAKLIFSNTVADKIFAVSNNGSFKISVEDEFTPQTFYSLISLNKDGDVSITSPPTAASPSLTVGGLPVCLEDGSGCPPALVGTITTIIGIPPIIASAPRSLGTTVDISADTGVNTGQLVRLVDATGSASGTGPGFLPAVDGSKLTNIVTKILPSTGITVSPVSGTGIVTLDLALGGSGTAQPWDQALTDISNIVYPPLSGQLIMGNGSGYIASAYSLPPLACLNGYVLSSDGSNFVCATSVSSFNIRTGAVMPQAGDYNALQITNTASGTIAATNVQAALNELDTEKLALAGGTMTGTIITTTQNAIELRPFAAASGNTGELRFNELFANGSLYVGFKAPDSIGPTPIVWTLPATDGGAGTVLRTNGSGILSWSALPGGSVVGPPVTTTGTVAGWGNGSGTLLASSTKVVTDLVTGPGVVANGIIASFNGASNTIQSSGIASTDVVTMTANGTLNRVAISAGANKLLTNTPYTIPTVNGVNGQVLTTNGAGVASWLDTGNVTGPGSAVLNNLPSFSNINGKVIQDSGIPSSNVVTMGTGATLTGQVILSTAAGKGISTAAYTFPFTIGLPGQVLKTDVVGNVTWQNESGDVTSLLPVAANNLVSFVGTGGKIIQDSGLATANIPTMANNGTLNYPVLSGGSNKTLVNASYSIPSTVCATGEVLKSNGTNMICQLDNGDVSSTGTFTANNLTAFVDATGKIIKDSGISVGNVVTNTAGSTDNAIARFDLATGKLIQNSVVTLSDTGDLSGVAAFTSTGNFTVTGSGSFTGDLTAQSYSNNSDRSLKKDIEPFTGAASLVDKLMPVTFRWKSGDEKKVIGLIAQDMEKVIPEVISTSNRKGKNVRSYDVGQVLILTLEALKETREELKQTQNELRAFQEKVKDLEKRIQTK